MPLSVGILTVSDRCSKGEAEDTSGPNLASILINHKSFEQLSDDHVVRKCVADEPEAIQEVLRDWSDELKLRLVLTTGGTGFAARDVTPEATKAVLDKEAPGLATAMLLKSLQITPMAILSRSVCGVRKETLIINLPGSKKAAQEWLEAVLPALPHALDLLSGNKRQVEAVHAGLTGCHGKHGAHHHERPSPAHSDSGFVPVSRRARHSPYSMISVPDAMALIDKHTEVKNTLVQHRVQDSLGYVLAESVCAATPLPPFPASVKDGYAVIASDGAGERRVMAPVTAGSQPAEVVVRSGEVSRITTGAPLPAGADAVVQVEDTELVEATEDGEEEKVVRILVAVQPGHDVRPVGVDIQSGQCILSQGSRIGACEVGLLSAVGATAISVVDQPRIAVLSTGNEVVDPSSELGAGQIYDSNRSTLLAALREQGFQAVDMGIARDSRESLKDKLTAAFDNADVVISSGGVSMGEMDLLKPVLKEDFGAEIHFGRVFMKPGKPTTFATVERKGTKKLVFALPGNPVSATVTFYLFVLPALRKMAGWKDFQLTTMTVKLSFPVSLDPRPEYQRVHVTWPAESSVPTAVSTGSQCSSRLLSLRSANALLLLPSSSTSLSHLQPGTEVQALVIPHSIV